MALAIIVGTVLPIFFKILVLDPLFKKDEDENENDFDALIKF